MTLFFKARPAAALVLGCLLVACATRPKLEQAIVSSAPPKAAQKEKIFEKFGDRRSDPYYWLRERENPEVMKLIQSENAYFDQEMAPTKSLQQKLYDEIRGRMPEHEVFPPHAYGPYEYSNRFESGQDYTIISRRLKAGGKDELLIDNNLLAKGHEFYELGTWQISHRQKKILLAIDTVGRQFYDLTLRDLETGKDTDLGIKGVTANVVWSSDDSGFYFVTQDTQTLRPEKVFYYDLATKARREIFYEKDATFFVSIGELRSENYLYINIAGHDSNEIRIREAKNPAAKWRVFLPRKREHLYEIDDGGDFFWVRSNDGAKNYRVFRTPHDRTARAAWKLFLGPEKDISFEDVNAFQNFLVVSLRDKGLEKLRVYEAPASPAGEWKMHEVATPDAVYSIGIGGNWEFATDRFRYGYESPVNPLSYFDYDVKNQKSILLRKREIPHYDAGRYETKRIFVAARDGTKIPVSLLYAKDFQSRKSKKARLPLFISGYGAYGLSESPSFSESILSLIDRGFVYALAHVRGGADMGQAWHDDGKKLKKKNTFTDFVDVTRELTARGYGDRGHVYAYGGSAGGLLMGAVANMAPELYRGIVADVPFVDVLTTMLDDSLPLTVGEYHEWGNPNDKKYYDYIRSYSPYDNVRKQAYPAIYAATALSDSQVQYWEPVKWVQKLRDNSTSGMPILLHVELAGGHSGKMGRFESIWDTVRTYAFVLSLEEAK